MAKKLIIGRCEWASFPEFNIGPVKVKTDTGARSSSIHAINIEEFDKDGEIWVRFTFVDDKNEDKHTEVEAPMWQQRTVRSSNGEKQTRYFIRTKIKFANNKVYPFKVSLTDRSDMRFPVLLGRRLLAGRFIVDVSESYALGDEES